jgi:hypothetical protein
MYPTSISGQIKLSDEKSSLTLFWSGVQVISSRPGEMKVRTIWERIEWTFLMRWPSSMTIDNVFERKLLQARLFDQAHFVRGNIHFKILRNEPARVKIRAIFFGACQRNDIEIGSPLLEFHASFEE